MSDMASERGQKESVMQQDPWSSGVLCVLEIRKDGRRKMGCSLPQCQGGQ